MDRINEILDQFKEIAYHPNKQLTKYKGMGKKAIGCFPYYVPEELVYAGDMVPFGVWGKRGTINQAKEYFASFYCTIAQMNMEMGLNGTLDGLDGVIVTSMCDTLRPLSQNFRVGVPQIPFIYLSHPQNRRPEYGIQFSIKQFTDIKNKLEEIAGHPISDEKIQEAIKVYNKSRSARRRFVQFAGQHPDVVSAVSRNAVLKSAYFMLKNEHTELLEELNSILAQREIPQWKGGKILTSGIIMDNPELLALFDANKLAIVADDIAHESRGFDVDAPENEVDGVRALAMHFALQDHDPLLYDPEINKRPAHLLQKIKNSGATGVIMMMMQFCDPEEFEYPSLKKALDENGIPHISLGFDHQMVDFGQAKTSLQAFSESI